MALIIYLYRFKNTKKLQLHLVAKLTNIPAMMEIDHDDHAIRNYISYYTAEGETDRVARIEYLRKMQSEPQSCKMGATRPYSPVVDPIRLGGFGCAEQDADQRRLTLIDRVTILTQEDGYEHSPYSENKIAEGWNAFIPKNKQMAEANKKNTEFDIGSRNCITIIHNLLMQKPFSDRSPEESKDEKLIGFAFNTFNLAKRVKEDMESKEQESTPFCSREEFGIFQEECQRWKNFWEPDEKCSLTCAYNNGQLLINKINPEGIRENFKEFLAIKYRKNLDTKQIEIKNPIINAAINSLELYNWHRAKHGDYNYKGYFKLFGYHKNIKLKAVEMAVKILKGEYQEMEKDELSAISSGRLKEYFSPFGIDILEENCKLTPELLLNIDWW